MNTRKSGVARDEKSVRGGIRREKEAKQLFNKMGGNEGMKERGRQAWMKCIDHRNAQLKDRKKELEAQLKGLRHAARRDRGGGKSFYINGQRRSERKSVYGSRTYPYLR